MPNGTLKTLVVVLEGNNQWTLCFFLAKSFQVFAAFRFYKLSISQVLQQCIIETVEKPGQLSLTQPLKN